MVVKMVVRPIAKLSAIHDRDRVSGLVSSLVISVVVKLTFSLRTRGNGLYLRLQPLPLALTAIGPACIDAFGVHMGAVEDRPDSGGD
jgi:hypothetical protein